MKAHASTYPRVLWMVSGLGVWGCSSLPPGAVEQIRQSDQAYRLSRFDEAERRADAVIVSHPAHPDTAEAYYLRGLSRLRSGRRGEARGDFNGGLKLAQRNDLKALLEMQLGHLHFEDERYGPSAACYGRALQASASSVQSELFWFRYGVSLQRGVGFAAARPALQRVVRGWPQGALAASAERKLHWPHDYFSVQVGAYSTAQLAQSAVLELRGDGIEATASGVPDRGAVRFVVQAGRYRDYGSAQGGLEQVRRFQRDAFVVP